MRKRDTQQVPGDDICEKLPPTLITPLRDFYSNHSSLGPGSTMILIDLKVEPEFLDNLKRVSDGLPNDDPRFKGLTDLLIIGDIRKAFNPAEVRRIVSTLALASTPHLRRLTLANFAFKVQFDPVRTPEDSFKYTFKSLEHLLLLNCTLPVIDHAGMIPLEETMTSTFTNALKINRVDFVVVPLPVQPTTIPRFMNRDINVTPLVHHLQLGDLHVDHCEIENVTMFIDPELQALWMNERLVAAAAEQPALFPYTSDASEVSICCSLHLCTITN